MKKIKLAIYSMHPIQYQVPIFKEITKNTNFDIIVLYGDKLGVNGYYNEYFKSFIKWDIPLLTGYKYRFFSNFTFKKITGFFSRFNPGMGLHILLTRYDVILIHGYQTFSAWIVLFAGKITGKKIIFRGEALIKNKNINLKTRINRFFIKFFLSNTDIIMYSCKGNKLYWKNLGVKDSKLFFMPCVVDNKYFQIQSKKLIKNKKDLRKELKIHSKDFVILFSGKFTERKRPFDLINAVSKIKNNKNCLILFIGDGPLKEAMQEKCLRNNIRTHFTGFINQSMLSRYYILADCVACISSYDASPKVLNEAMNFSLPVIVSNMVGTAEDLVDKKNGYIIDVGDVDSIADSLRQIILNPKRKILMGKESFFKVSKFNLQSNSKIIKEAVNFLLVEN